MLILRRISKTPQATFGVLIGLHNKPLCWTLERPWLFNNRNISSIPSGAYKCTKDYSKKFGDVIRVHDVPNRSGILIHSGNHVSDSQGCILVGQMLQNNVLRNSKAALQDLINICDNEFMLSIWEE
jgi:hypothetical protein